MFSCFFSHDSNINYRNDRDIFEAFFVLREKSISRFCFDFCDNKTGRKKCLAEEAEIFPFKIFQRLSSEKDECLVATLLTKDVISPVISHDVVTSAIRSR